MMSQMTKDRHLRLAGGFQAVSMYEDWGETFDHVPPAAAAFAEWYLTAPEDREADEKTMTAWCFKNGHSRAWGANLQTEPEFQRFIGAKAEAMGFTQLHIRAVWENYYRLAASSSDFRAARNFLMDTQQIKPAGAGFDQEDDGDLPDEQELLDRQKEHVLGELEAGRVAAEQMADAGTEAQAAVSESLEGGQQ